MKNRTELTRGFVNALRRGNTRANACAVLGVATDTFYRWVRTDKDFRTAIEKADAHFVDDKLDIINTAAETPNQMGQCPWQAAAWLLERRRPHDFGRNNTLQPEQLLQIAMDALGRQIKNNPRAGELWMQLQAECAKQADGKALPAHKAKTGTPDG